MPLEHGGSCGREGVGNGGVGAGVAVGSGAAGGVGDAITVDIGVIVGGGGGRVGVTGGGGVAVGGGPVGAGVGGADLVVNSKATRASTVGWAALVASLVALNPASAVAVTSGVGPWLSAPHATAADRAAKRNTMSTVLVKVLPTAPLNFLGTHHERQGTTIRRRLIYPPPCTYTYPNL